MNLRNASVMEPVGKLAQLRGACVPLDAGPCTGEPSTVVDCTGEEVKLLRAGRIPWDEVQSAVSGQ